MNGLTRNLTAALTVVSIFSATLLLQGCYDNDYFAHRDTITLGAGDAGATAAAVHTIDPWPPYAKNTDIDLDGQRGHVAMERYKKNKSIEPQGLATTESTSKAGAGNSQVQQ